MVASAYSNLSAHEGIVVASTSVDFPWRSRTLTITNDTVGRAMKVRMGGSTLTLKGEETLSTNFWVMGVVLSASASVDYRVWAFG